jgi:hypothetical protein
MHVLGPFLSEMLIPRKMKISLSLRRLAKRVLSATVVVGQVRPTPTRRDFRYHADADTSLQFCWLSHSSRLWCSAAVQYAPLIAFTTGPTKTNMCGIATKLSTTNIGRSKRIATIETFASDTPMNRRNTGLGGTIITMIGPRNHATC